MGSIWKRHTAEFKAKVALAAIIGANALLEILTTPCKLRFLCCAALRPADDLSRQIVNSF